MKKAPKIGILGAGIVGLNTAYLIKEKHRDWDVVVVADKFNQETLSDGAAGIFRPGTSFCGPTPEITKQWMIDAYHFYRDILNSREAGPAGISEVSGYVFSSKHPEVTRNQFLEGLLPVYRQATEKELKLCPGEWKYGAYFTTLLIESRYYLPWITKKFTDLGGRIEKRTVTSLPEFAKDFDVAVNCTGFAAKKLCNDTKLVPLRGQIYKVKAPWIKTFFYGDFDTYIVPGIDAVTLGGCRQYDSYKEEVDKYDSQSIMDRCTSLVPSLKEAEVLREWVGLRPHRDPVRVEKEILKNDGGKPLKIVHQYGHGGYGVTTAPGTAKYAVKLVEELVEGNLENLKSKL